MAEIFTEEQPNAIPYESLAAELFSAARKQKLVPFLGAGASLPGSPSPKPHADVPLPSEQQIEQIHNTLGLTSDTARLIVSIAARIASHVEAAERTKMAPASDALARVKASPMPPSANELAEALAQLSRYESFEHALAPLRKLLRKDADAPPRAVLLRVLESIAAHTGITPPTAPLVAVSSYLEYKLRRARLWEALREIFVTKRTPLAIHHLIAAAARFYFQQDPLKDYLIVTTNYDCLMETALEMAEVPLCVLTVDKTDRKVYARFSRHVPVYLGLDEAEYREFVAEHKGKSYPSTFSLQKNKPLAVLYKIHGCLFADETSHDSVVISDEDYVDYIHHMSDNQGTIPAAITPLMADKGFLFLGYSFSDWNVRSVYRKIVERRAAPEGTLDYSVMRDISVYEQGFFTRRQIHILKTDLARFVAGITQYSSRIGTAYAGPG